MTDLNGVVDIVTVERAFDARRLEAELRRRMPSDGALTVRFIDPSRELHVESNGNNRVCVLLTKTSKSARDVGVQRCVEGYIKAGVPLIAAYQPRNYRLQTPSVLHAINGFAWGEGGSADRLATTLLRLIGLDERERRIFLSYRRGHGEQIVRQLRYALIDAGWHVFLDTFGIEPGADFQRDLFRALDSMSLLLVVEGPETRESQWVDDELAYATAHGVGIRAMVLPDVENRTFPRYAEDKVFHISPDTLIRSRGAQDRRLRQPVLRRWVDDLQADHTAAH